MSAFVVAFVYWFLVFFIVSILSQVYMFYFCGILYSLHSGLHAGKTVAPAKFHSLWGVRREEDVPVHVIKFLIAESETVTLHAIEGKWMKKSRCYVIILQVI